jgi:methyl-accepting chemotaxis protein
MKISFSTKLLFGFVVSSLLIVAIAFLCENFNYFGWVSSDTGRVIFLGCLSVAFGAVFGYTFGFYLTRSIKNLTDATSVISRGDLRQKIAVRSDDELGSLAFTFNQMVESLVGMVHEVRTVSDTIYDSASNLSSTSDHVNSSAHEISKTVKTIARGAGIQAEMGLQTHEVTKQLAESIDVVAQKADSANRLAQEIFAKAQEGNQHTTEAVARMTDVAGKIDNASRLVQGFRDRTLGINNAVLHITSIAQQTHLLALNATIEAARAGENGKGFAVVAEEVRKLSHETRKLASQISDLAESINRESQQVLTSMTDSNASASESTRVVNAASSALRDIVSDIQCSVGQVQEITRLTREQTLSSAKLVAVIEQIAKIAEENASGTQQATAATHEQTNAMQALAASAQELSKTSDRLKSCISTFQY